MFGFKSCAQELVLEFQKQVLPTLNVSDVNVRGAYFFREIFAGRGQRHANLTQWHRKTCEAVFWGRSQWTKFTRDHTGHFIDVAAFNDPRVLSLTISKLLICTETAPFFPTRPEWCTGCNMRQHPFVRRSENKSLCRSCWLFTLYSCICWPTLSLGCPALFLQCKSGGHHASAFDIVVFIISQLCSCVDLTRTLVKSANPRAEPLFTSF